MIIANNLAIRICVVKFEVAVRDALHYWPVDCVDLNERFSHCLRLSYSTAFVVARPPFLVLKCV